MNLKFLNVDLSKNEVVFSLSKEQQEFDLKEVNVEFCYKNDVVDRYYTKEIKIIEEIKEFKKENDLVIFTGNISMKDKDSKNKFVKEFIRKFVDKEIKNYGVFDGQVGYVGEFKITSITIHIDKEEAVKLLESSDSMRDFGFEIKFKILCREYEDFKQRE